MGRVAPGRLAPRRMLVWLSESEDRASGRDFPASLSARAEASSDLSARTTSAATRSWTFICSNNAARCWAARDLAIATPARALHALLVAPLADLLGGRTRWVLAPDGPLWQLPFQALRTAAGHDLVESVTLEYTPSLTASVELRGRPATRAAARPLDLAAFGASVTRTGASLPDAEHQVRAIARLYPAGKAAVYVGATAREPQAREAAARARILHIAAHGQVDDASPLYSRLLLAGTDAGGDLLEGSLRAEAPTDLLQDHHRRGRRCHVDREVSRSLLQTDDPAVKVR